MQKLGKLFYRARIDLTFYQYHKAKATYSSSLSMRISRGLDGVVAFGALYLTTLFSVYKRPDLNVR